MEPIRVITTGGTFDKEYDEIAGNLTFRTSHLETIIKRTRCTYPITLEVNQLIDSLEMDEKRRSLLLQSCRDSPEKRIVIIHGTDTMVESARIIADSITADKTVILTGAMRPFIIRDSDALFNFGCAIIAAQTLANGVYILMNGTVFNWDNVKKNRQIGIFQKKEEE